jgi:uncharacterized protein (DUF1778 family)
MARGKEIVTITIRMTPEQHALLRRAAALDERSLNSFVLRAIAQRARAIVRREAAEPATTVGAQVGAHGNKEV